MTETINKYGTYRADHTKFGGYICLSDFNTDCRGKDNTNGSAIANRIIQDQNFDNQCRKNKEYISNDSKKGKKKNAKNN